MKKKLITGLIFSLILTTGISIFLYSRRDSHSTIFCGSIDDTIRPRNYCLMNPFRDKRPENLAEGILRELKNGNSQAIVPYIADLSEDEKNQFLENEKKFLIEDWRIGEREDSANKVEIMYWVSRKDYYEGHQEEVRFFFVNDGTDWKLNDFGAIY